MLCSRLVCPLHVHSMSVCCCILLALESLSEMNFEVLRNLKRGQKRIYSILLLFRYSAFSSIPTCRDLVVHAWIKTKTSLKAIFQ